MNEINFKLLKQIHLLQPVVRTKVMAVGSYLPKQRVTSDEIMHDIGTEQKYGIRHDWMSAEMGIIERRMVTDDQRPSQLAIEAANNALESCPDLDLDLIDAVIFCGIERDRPEPATAHVIQRALGLNANHVFDVANACFGFFDGLKLASSLIESGAAKYGLIVTGEVSTKVAKVVANQLKRGMPITEAKHLWGILSAGDAGGAMIIGPSDDGNSGFMKFHQASKSQYLDLCHYNWKPNGEVEAHMDMGKIVARGLRLNKQIYREALDELGWDGVDWAIAHQTGDAAFKQAVALHGLDKGKIVKTYPELGNVTTATLPLSFQKLIDSGNLKVGDKVGGLFAGSGLVAGQFGYVA
ncbi:MAG: 3-oxoacyl-[acyl-carrier-protein] synthase-3 [Arenicella sp.]|jgi:3-oxoacyl-[acyl-carrier-protein] synthase-3